MIDDCLKSIELTVDNMKAFYFLGNPPLPHSAPCAWLIVRRPGPV